MTILYVLDTDHVSLNQRGHDGLRAKITAHTAAEIATTVITLEEQMRGWLSLLAKATTGERRVQAYRLLRETAEEFARITVLDYTATAESEFQRLRRAGLRIGSQDLRIAAIALTQDGILLTRNVRDFGEVPGLRLENWTT
jgi:tRNA(fMet)-specific endonuclease VapC